MKRKFKILLAVILLSAGLQAYAVQTIQAIQIEKDSALSLNDCIRIALNNSPVVKRSIFNYDIAVSSVGVAKSAYFPSISLGVGYNQSFG